MIYTALTVKAMKLSYQAHQGQLDKSGLPYIFHPYHLAEQMGDEISVCAALLHDVVEDTEITLAELQAEFPHEITEAVRLLTHDDTVDYPTYIRRIKKNPTARAVKLADIAHNSDETRFIAGNSVSEQKRRQLREKYRMARELLEQPE